MPSISSLTSPILTSSRFFSTNCSCSISVFDLDVISVSLTARRLPPLAPQVSQVGNAALIEREAVTLPLDHAFGFELADVGPAAIEMQRQCRRKTGSATDPRSIVTVSAIVFVPVGSRLG
jgi:hypothetical protein